MRSKILIIEDDSFLGDVLLRKLTGEGFSVSLVKDAEQGLKDIASVRPDMVLLDIILPKMNGYEMLEKKQKDPAIKDVPVIIISNSGQQVDVARARDLGAKEYLIKADFDPNEVVEKVRQYLPESASDSSAPPVASPSGTAMPSADSSVKGLKVTIVEDDKLLADLLTKKLVAAGCALSHAIDGSEALNVVKRQIPDIIILDILLPGMDGFEVLKVLKSDETLKHIPVLLLSNLGQDKDVEKGRDLGAASFLVKATVSLDEILDEMKKILGVEQAQ